MPSKSEAQARLMAAAARDPAVARARGIPYRVAVDFHEADKKRARARAKPKAKSKLGDEFKKD